MKWMIMIITFIVEIAFTYFIANQFSVRFIEVMFFTGLAFSVITFWFSSSGGAVTRHMDGQISARTGYMQQPQYLKFTGSPVFTASILFLFIGFIFFILLLTGTIPPAA